MDTQEFGYGGDIDAYQRVGPVFKALALQTRFRSRQEQPLGAKLLAAMRNQFGGHSVRKA